jgi:hypothetical protein
LHFRASLTVGLTALVIGKIFIIPVVMFKQNSIFARNYVSLSGVARTRKGALGASAYFAVSTPFVRLLEDSLGLTHESIAVLPDPIDHLFPKAPFKLNPSVLEVFKRNLVANSVAHVTHNNGLGEN